MIEAWFRLGGGRLPERLFSNAVPWEAVMAKPSSTMPRQDHKEAVRLTLKAMHIPFGTIVVGALLLVGILSAIAMVWGYGPANPIP
jgi:hypothetical protein